MPAPGRHVGSDRTRASWQPYRKETQYLLVAPALERISTIAAQVAALVKRNASVPRRSDGPQGFTRREGQLRRHPVARVGHLGLVVTPLDVPEVGRVIPLAADELAELVGHA